MSDVFARNCFTDLNVLVQSSKKINKEIILSLIDYGYERAAFNHEVELAKKVQLKAAPDISTLIGTLPSPKGHHPFQLVQRLTVSVSDPSVLHSLTSPSVGTYDLLAIQPETDKVLQQACSVLNIDIISLKLDERLPLKLKHAQIGQAVERGIHLEICYSPAIRDATARRNTLANALELVDVARGKNIIVSSKAEKSMDVRAPADVMNLCHLFGITSGTCKSCITSHCRSALLHSAMHWKTAKGVVSSEVVRDESSTGCSNGETRILSESKECESEIKSKKRKRTEVTKKKGKHRKLT